MSETSVALLLAEHVFYLESADKALLDRAYRKFGLEVRYISLPYEANILKGMNDYIRDEMRSGK